MNARTIVCIHSLRCKVKLLTCGCLMTNGDDDIINSWRMQLVSLTDWLCDPMEVSLFATQDLKSVHECYGVHLR